MITQHVRKYGAKARYQGEEAGEGQVDRSHEVSMAKNSVGRLLEAECTEHTAPADPPALDEQVERDYSSDIGLKLLSSGGFNP